jgi:hybrid cluster-associated redox disulfide protein
MAKKKITKKPSKSASKKLAGSKNSCFLKSAKKEVKKKEVKKTASKLAGSKNKSFLKEAKQLITKKMLIGEVASKYPAAVEIMFKHGMHCIGCGMTAYESLEQGCQGHGMSEEEIDKMVEEMNQLINK